MKKRTLNFIPFFSLLAALLGGCTSPQPSPDALTMALQQQAATINSQLPVTDDGVILVRATASMHQMSLKLYMSNPGQPASRVLQHYADSLCQQSDVRKRLEHGASYLLGWTNNKGEGGEQILNHC